MNDYNIRQVFNDGTGTGTKVINLDENVVQIGYCSELKGFGKTIKINGQSFKIHTLSCIFEIGDECYNGEDKEINFSTIELPADIKWVLDIKSSI